MSLSFNVYLLGENEQKVMYSIFLSRSVNGGGWDYSKGLKGLRCDADCGSDGAVWPCWHRSRTSDFEI